MRRMKRIVASVLLAALLAAQGAVTYAAEGECQHDWRRDRIDLVYEYEGECGEHGEVCKVHIWGYNVINKCKKCNTTESHHYTEEEHHYLSR